MNKTVKAKLNVKCARPEKDKHETHWVFKFYDKHGGHDNQSQPPEQDKKPRSRSPSSRRIYLFVTLLYLVYTF